MAKQTSTKVNAKNQAVVEIARKVMSVETLETQNMDALDFHELAVWTIKEALEAAYAAGYEAALRATSSK